MTKPNQEINVCNLAVSALRIENTFPTVVGPREQLSFRAAQR